MLRDAKMGFDGWAPMPAREMVAGVALLRGGAHRDGFFSSLPSSKRSGEGVRARDGEERMTRQMRTSLTAVCV